MTYHSQHSEARHVNYVRVWGILIVALLVSLALAYLQQRTLAAALIFAIAIVKALIVAGYYMHLKFDSGLFSWLFVAPMVVIALIVIALLRFYGHW